MIICILAMQRGVWAVSFAREHFINEAFFEFVKLGIIVFDFVVSNYKGANY